MRTIALFTVLAILAGSALAADPLPVLLVDGQNNHDWARMQPILKATLEKSGLFKVDVISSPDNKADDAAWVKFRPEFAKYKAVVTNYNGKMWPDEVKAAFEQYVAGGGGVVVVHAANNAFPGWSEYDKMIGLGWRGADYGDRITTDTDGKVIRTPKGQGPGAGHGSVHPFQVIVRDNDHPVMKGMPRAWLHAADELYHGQRGPAENMKILATAFSAKDKGGTNEHEPMVWEIPYGKGKVLTTVMGHVWSGGATTALHCVGFKLVLCRATEFVATGKVTQAVPENFPTETQASLVEDK